MRISDAYFYSPSGYIDGISPAVYLLIGYPTHWTIDKVVEITGDVSSGCPIRNFREGGKNAFICNMQHRKGKKNPAGKLMKPLKPHQKFVQRLQV